jgi:hypothetical protein
MRSHVQVHGVIDRLEIPGRKDLAECLFKYALSDEWKSKHFPSDIDTVFETAPLGPRERAFARLWLT